MNQISPITIFNLTLMKAWLKVIRKQEKMNPHPPTKPTTTRPRGQA